MVSLDQRTDKLEFVEEVRKMNILCVGDSLTYGNVGYSYLPFLNKSFKTINKGLNGDTLYGLTNRLEKILINDKSNYDLMILGIGINDILLPYLKRIDLYWKLQMSIRCKLKRCMDHDSIFLICFDNLMKMIHSKGKKAIVFGLPYINLTDFPNNISTKRNQEMKFVCEKYGFDFIDIYRLQEENLPTEKKIYSWKWSFLVRVLDAATMTLFPKSKDRFASNRELVQTVDGVHFSSITAKLLAKEIESKVVVETLT